MGADDQHSLVCLTGVPRQGASREVALHLTTLLPALSSRVSSLNLPLRPPGDGISAPVHFHTVRKHLYRTSETRQEDVDAVLATSQWGTKMGRELEAGPMASRSLCWNSTQPWCTALWDQGEESKAPTLGPNFQGVPKRHIIF